MKVKLSVLERIGLLNILPTEENYLTYKLVRDLKTELSFSDKDFKELKIITTQDQKVRWDEKADKGKSVEVPDVIVALVKVKLESLEKEKKINDQNAPLYEKFVLDK